MKKNKLWIWSLIMGLLATFVLYLIISTNDKEEAVKTTNIVANTDNTKEVKKQTTQANTNINESNQNKNNDSKDDNNVNKVLNIGDGKRAMSIQVTDVSGVSGFIKSGSMVDIAAKVPVPKDIKPGQHDAAKMILQNVKVLAVGHVADDVETAKRYQMVTVEVNPKDGLILGLSTKYELFLLLRKEGDNNLDSTKHYLEDQLLEGVFIK